MWIGAEAGRHDIGVKHFQLFWSLKLCGVLIGADWDPSDNEKHTKLVSYRTLQGVPVRSQFTRDGAD